MAYIGHPRCGHLMGFTSGSTIRSLPLASVPTHLDNRGHTKKEKNLEIMLIS